VLSTMTTATSVSPRVLVVEDEPMVAEVVERYLRRDGFDVKGVGDGVEAMKAFQAWVPDLVVLDIMLPGIDGMEVCRRIRAASDVPIIILTARGEEPDRLLGLGLGADDYIVKPFSPRELAARVRTVLRRGASAGATAGEMLRFGELSINGLSRQVVRADSDVELTAKEFDLLFYLAQHPRQVFSREQLMDAVWDYAFAGDASTVTVHVRRLRAKLEPNPKRPRYIKTVRGVGYKFDP
jgi:DNA-binding response OmpR family regulator